MRSRQIPVARCIAGLLVSCALFGCVSVDLASLLEPSLEEVTLQESDRSTRNKILVLDVSGVIASQPAGTFSMADRCCPDTIKAVLNQAEMDRDIKAVVLRIDTPGGGVAPSDMIYHEIKSFSRRTGRPVIASIMGLGCSGGYYIACAADAVYAHPTSVTGSIGVIAVFPRLKRLADKVGWEQTVVKSGKMKDMGNPLREMPEDERRVFQNMIDDFYGEFLAKVVACRPAFETPEQLKPIADGRIYTAKQALEAGLIDGIGYLDDVVDVAKQRAGIARADVVAYAYGPNENPTLYSPTGADRLPAVSLINVDTSLIPGALEPGFHYRWLPGR